MVRPVPLRRSLFLQFFAFSAVPLAVVVLLVAALMVETLIDDVEHQTTTLGAAMRDQIEARLASRQNALELMAFAFTQRQGDGAAQQALMRELVRTDAVVDALYAVDAQGRVDRVALGSESGLHEADMLGIDLGSRPFYEALRTSRHTVWSDTFLSALTGRVTAVLAVPTGGGALVAELSLLSLSRAVEALAAPTGDLIAVFDSQGRIIGHRDAALAARQVNLRPIELVRQGMEGHNAAGRFEWEGVPYLGSVSHIGRTSWSVLVARPTGAVYAPLLGLGWAVGAGLVVALAGALAGALWLSRSAEGRYRKLVQAAGSYARAEEPAPVEFDILEFDQLWQHLRRLFDQIAQRDAETRAARLQLQNVFDATTEVSIVAARADGLITVFNRGAEKMLGHAAGVMVGQQSLLVLHDPAELARRARELTAQLGRAVEGFEVLVAVAAEAGYEVRDWTYLRRDGSRVAVSVAVTAVRNSGGLPAGYLAVATDQTEAHRAAGLEVARQVAEAASQNKSEFLSRVSHDLRTPLNAMLGFAQLLAMDSTQPLTQVQRDRVALIESAGWHLVRLIDDVLDLSRMEAGQLRITMEPVELVPAIDDAVRLVSAQAQQFGVTIAQALPCGSGAPPLLVWADRTRLIQVLVNLLSNAVKYNVRGGQVMIRVDGSDAQQLRIEVSDTGRGMSETQLARLFEPFNRLGMETSGIEGTGIGMVIVRRLLEMMDCSLDVHSRVGTGTRMTVSVRRSPLPRPAAGTGTPVTPEPAAAGGMVDVVCIEDNAINSLLMGQIFALRPGCRLHLANTTEGGLALIRRLRPKLVMLDLHLPDGSGLALLERLRLDEELRATPVIVVSADGTQHSAHAAQNAGVRAFLAKPIQIAQALQAIDDALA